MNQRVLKHKRRTRFLTALLTASLFSGCQPAGTGSIDVDRANPAVSGFKTIEPVKKRNAAGSSKQPAGTKSAADRFPMTRTPHQRSVTLRRRRRAEPVRGSLSFHEVSR